MSHCSGPNAVHTKLLPSGWDLEDLGHPNLLKKVLPQSCPGITTTYGYLGNPGSTFAYHVEDACLGSMNVNLGGGAKMWYVRVNVSNVCFCAVDSSIQHDHR